MNFMVALLFLEGVRLCQIMMEQVRWERDLAMASAVEKVLAEDTVRGQENQMEKIIVVDRVAGHRGPATVMYQHRHPGKQLIN